MQPLEFVAYTYIATLILVLMMEFLPWEKVRRRAALVAMPLALVAGSVWVYDAYFKRSPWPDFLTMEKPAPRDSSKKGQSRGSGGQNGGGDAVMSDDGGADGGDLIIEEGDGSGSGNGEVIEEAKGTSGGAGAYLKRRMSRFLGLGEEPVPVATALDSIKDCPDCPILVTVQPGEEVIGAADGDVLAQSVEKPARMVKFWPGFLIARSAVSQESYDAFLKDTGRAPSACQGRVAAAGAEIAGMNVVESTQDGPATCVSAAEADAYAGWLSARTGKRFRLPTAIEWEFAVKAKKDQDLRVGEIAEIVADCWQERVPRAGFERLATDTPLQDCQSRMLKGASSNEDAIWQRSSARRLLGPGLAKRDAGFRVMRPL